MQRKKKLYKKIALAFCLMMAMLWTVMGTGASLAWFQDTSEEVKNVIHMAEFDLEVSYRSESGDYLDLESATSVFDRNALYEPGHTQVVYLKVENLGTVPFEFKTAVSVLDYSEPTNLYGQTFHLQDYLRFGIVSAPTEAELTQKIGDRETAVSYATEILSNYSTQLTTLEAKGEVYLALIVGMPWEVGNAANYQGDIVPRVDLGIVVDAYQQGMF